MPRKNWPNYIVFFNNIYDDIKYIFENSNYKEVSFILFHEKKKKIYIYILLNLLFLLKKSFIDQLIN